MQFTWICLCLESVRDIFRFINSEEKEQDIGKYICKDTFGLPRNFNLLYLGNVNVIKSSHIFRKESFTSESKFYYRTLSIE